jgi:hypothetical protein
MDKLTKVQRQALEFVRSGGKARFWRRTRKPRGAKHGFRMYTFECLVRKGVMRKVIGVNDQVTHSIFRGDSGSVSFDRHVDFFVKDAQNV